MIAQRGAGAEPKIGMEAAEVSGAKVPLPAGDVQPLFKTFSLCMQPQGGLRSKPTFSCPAS